MNYTLIRIIDKWVGIPACFLMSLAHKFLSLFNKAKNQVPRPQKILFTELSEMGSAILAYPAMKYVVTRYSEAEVFFLIFEQNRGSVDILDIIPRDHVFTINIRSPLRFLFSTLKAVRTINKTGIDTIIDFERFARFTALLSVLIKAETRVGFNRYQDEGLYRGDFMSHPVVYNHHQHIAKNFLALVRSVGMSGEKPFFKAVISDALTIPHYQSSEKNLSRLKKRLAAINPQIYKTDHLILFNLSNGEPLPNRAWPVSNYAVLAKRISEHFNAVIVFVGQEDAKGNAKRIMSSVEADFCIDFTNQTSFSELLNICNLADVLITADSGLAHFAALTPIKNIVLFGPETPVLYGPLGQNCRCLYAGFSCSPCFSVHNHCQTICQDAQCMKAITADEVFEIIYQYLKEKI